MARKKRKRRAYTPEEEVAHLRRHLLEKVPVSDLCEELVITNNTPGSGPRTPAPEHQNNGPRNNAPDWTP